jgi:hypothetical protein
LKILFGTENWFLYLVICIVFAFGITLLIYFRNKETVELRRWQLRILFTLRFLSVFLLSLLLMTPFVKTLKRFINNPVIITSFDNSLSMLAASNPDSARQEISTVYNHLQEAFKGNYKLVNYTFGEEAVTNHPLDFSEKKSDYSDLVDEVYNDQFNDNIGAMIIVGDGIYNRGENPVSGVGRFSFPVYCIGIGDTNIVTDASITNIKVNRNAFVGNKFPAELNLHFEKMANQPVTLRMLKDEIEVFNQRLVPSNDDYFTTLNLSFDAEKPGLQHYSAELITNTKERNRLNNLSDFVINVLQNKQKILVLSEGPHPDIGAIKNTLELQPNYEVSVFTSEPYPVTLKDFNLIIMNQIPSASLAGRSLVTKSLESKIPLLILVGNKTFLPQLKQLNLGIEIVPQSENGEEAQPVINPDFGIFSLNEEMTAIIEKFPPLQVSFSDYKLDPSLSVMLYQNIKTVKTQRPLVAMGNLEGRKVGFIFGEGIWRWRLYNYYLNESHQQFDEFVEALIQYLSLRENDDNFIVKYQQVVYDSDPVILTAEVYNKNFELINTSEVTATLTDQKGNTFQFVFDKDGKYYRLNAGKLPVGNYNFTAKVTVGKEEFSETGNFAVMPLNIENVVTKADFNVLFQMANNTGGKFYTKEGLDELITTVKNNQNIKPTSYFQTAINEILNLKGLFFVLLIIFGMEWFLRKYWGIY